jgi:class 3 adenylate cyclase
MTSRLPDQNPNPVLVVGGDGRVTYANAPGQTLSDALGISKSGDLSGDLFRQLNAAAHEVPPRAVEVKVGVRTFSLLPVADPAVPGHLNLFATDVTAARAIERFPDNNPNPVFRLSRNGVLIYANPASSQLLEGLACVRGEPIPEDLSTRIFDACDAGRTIEERVQGRTWELKPVLVREFDFINVYGTDVSAVKALTKFPDQNPNPILRFTHDGRLLYANRAAAVLCRGMNTTVGDMLPDSVWDRVLGALKDPVAEPIEVLAEDHTFELTVVDVPEFGFVNAYGTDVTAARLVEQAHQENERLLLNILPASIAARLRGGETVIADEFDELSVLFADVVGFTNMAAQLTATEVVQVLTDLFSACDELADRYGLEKIKTIGDAYMAVGGIGREDPDAPQRVAAMALDMLDAISAYRAPKGLPVQVRIGLHTGPAVAGVIGIRKFFYDVWGDTVNTASRLEGTAAPGTIQLLDETRQRLGDEFTFELRGPVELKGKGTFDAWLLTGRAAVAAGAGERGTGASRSG